MSVPRSPLLQELLSTGKLSSYSKGQIIQSTEGQQTLNFIKSGFVKRYLISNTGNLGVEVIYCAFDTFPLTLMLHTIFDQDVYEGPEVYFYEAMGDTKVYTITIDVLAEAVKKDPNLYRDLLLETGRRLHTTLNSLENIALKSPYHRVAHQLAYFGSEFGEQLKSGVKITIPLTSQDIADVLRLSEVTVSSCLSQLQDKGLIKIQKSIIIPRLEKLKEEAHK